jgi:hypothetical protein
VIVLIQVGEQAMTDRYTYLPLIGLYVVAAWAAEDLVARRAAAAKRSRNAMALFAMLALLACVVSSWAQLRHWRSSIDLYTHAIQVYPANPRMYNNLVMVLQSQGESIDAIGFFAWR